MQNSVFTVCIPPDQPVIQPYLGEMSIAVIARVRGSSRFMFHLFVRLILTSGYIGRIICLAACSIRLRAISKYPGSISTPMKRLPSCIHATPVVPLPAQISRMVSPGFVYVFVR